jgi:hypothetical protein
MLFPRFLEPLQCNKIDCSPRLASCKPPRKIISLLLTFCEFTNERHRRQVNNLGASLWSFSAAFTIRIGITAESALMQAFIYHFTQLASL